MQLLHFANRGRHTAAFQQPGVCKNVDDPPDCLLNSPYIQWLDGQLGGAILNPDGNPGGARVLLLAIAGDGVSFWDHSKVTTGVLALKCLGLPPELAATLMASYTLGFFGGGHEPSIVSDALSTVIDSFLKYIPSSNGAGAHAAIQYECVTHPTCHVY